MRGVGGFRPCSRTMPARAALLDVCVCVCRLWVGACRASQCVCGRSQMRPQQSFQAVALCMWSYAVLV